MIGIKNVIAIVCGGGPAPGINSVISGIVNEATCHGWDVLGIYDGFSRLARGEKNYVRLEPTDISRIHLTGGCILKMSRFNPTKKESDLRTVVETLTELGVTHLVTIGGDDTAYSSAAVSEFARKVGRTINVVHVPKTIDNDLAVTDHTPGFGSAAKFIAATMKEIIRDGLVYDYPTVTIVEIMGRNAGWLTAAAALAKSDDCEGVDLIYLPEKVFDIDHFMARVKEIAAKGRSMVIAVSEGIKVADGRYVFELSEHVEFVDAFGHKQLAGSAKFLANKIGAELGIKTRAIELSTLQRCAAHMTSRTDITEAYNVGGAAVKAAFEGETGKVVVLKRVSDDPYMCITETNDVHQIANIEKKVPLEWITDDDFVTEDLIQYIRPLIQAELSPIMVDGLPRHLNINA